MVLNALISVVYSTVVEAWSLAVLTTPVFLLAALSYSYYRDLEVLDFVEDVSEYFISVLVVSGFLLSSLSFSTPSGNLVGQLIALVYLFFVFWRY